MQRRPTKILTARVPLETFERITALAQLRCVDRQRVIIDALDAELDAAELAAHQDEHEPQRKER